MRLLLALIVVALLALVIGAVLGPSVPGRAPPSPPEESAAAPLLPGDLSLADRAGGRPSPAEDLDGGPPTASQGDAGSEEEEEDDYEFPGPIIDGWRYNADGTKEYVGRPGRLREAPRPFDPGYEAPGSLARALLWLRDAQKEDGSWEGGPGVTGLAVIAYLWSGHSHKRGTYKQTVREALKHLKQIQDPVGRFQKRETRITDGEHALATLAMVEAYRVTRSPLFKQSARLAIDHLLARRPRELSSVLWGALACFSSSKRELLPLEKITAGLPRPEEALELTCDWSYPPEDVLGRWAAAPLLSLAAGEEPGPADPGLLGAMTSAPPPTLVVLAAAADAATGDEPAEWMKALTARLEQAQVKGEYEPGSLVGSFSPEGTFGELLGRAGTTAAAAAVLALCVPENRHPLTRHESD